MSLISGHGKLAGSLSHPVTRHPTVMKFVKVDGENFN
jgi:hypothetical protein